MILPLIGVVLFTVLTWSFQQQRAYICSQWHIWGSEAMPPYGQDIYISYWHTYKKI